MWEVAKNMSADLLVRGPEDPRPHARNLDAYPILPPARQVRAACRLSRFLCFSSSERQYCLPKTGSTGGWNGPVRYGPVLLTDSVGSAARVSYQVKSASYRK